MRHVHPKFFVLNEADIKPFTANIIQLHDHIKYYCMTTVSDDVSSMTDSALCLHRHHEQDRAKSLLSPICTLTGTGSDWLQNLDEDFTDAISDLKGVLLETLSFFDENMPATDIAKQINVLVATCKKMLDKVLPILPTMKSRIHEFTDGGPGVGVSNRDVQFRAAEIIQLLDLDYYLRFHLASDDSSQNEVERMQSYVGDAICDGGMHVYFSSSIIYNACNTIKNIYNDYH